MKRSLFSIRVFLTLFVSRLAGRGFNLSGPSACNAALFSILVTFSSITIAQPASAADPASNMTSPIFQSLLQDIAESGFTGSGNPDGSLGQISETTFVPSNGLQVAIVGGNKTIADTDSVPGELVTLTGTATASSGTITKTEWLINGTVVATGTSATIALNDGTNVISFKGTDDNGNSRTASVTYTVASGSSQLPRTGSINTQQIPRGSQFSIAVRDSNSFLVSIAPVTQTFDISGFIFPQTADALSTADIFVVALTPIGWFMRNQDGAFVPWNGSFASLLPAYENQVLTDQLRVNIFSGKLPMPGTYWLYLAYMRTDSGELIYVASPKLLSITAQ